MSISGIFKPKNVLKGKILTLPLIDKTLTQKNKAADAKITGDAIADVKKKALDAHNENAIAILKERTERKAEIAVERARIDNIVTNNNDTEGNAELRDIRVSADGTVHPSAGEAVRGQFLKVDDKIKDYTVILQKGNINNTNIELGTLDINKGEIVSKTVSRCNDFIPIVAGNTIYAIFENTTIKYISCLFYDKNKAGVSTSNLYGKNMTTSDSLVTEITIPDDAVYMRFYHANANIDYKVGIYYSYYNATTVENYVAPAFYVNAEKLAKNGQLIDVEKFVTSNVLTADAQAKDKNYIVPEYEYNIAAVAALRKQLESMWIFAKDFFGRGVLDSGLCGENLTWTLYTDGLLKISGTGRSYDYCKGVLIGKTRGEIEAAVANGSIPAEYAFQDGKIYDDENGQYVSPWYKYRNEISFTEYGGNYCSKASYDKENPNGWTYNRIEIDEGVTYIGDWLFYRVSGATELIIPESVTELGDWAIRYSPTLKCIYLPDGITKVGYRGCSRNEVATAIRVGSGLTTVGDYAFAQNSMVKYLNVQGNANTAFGEFMCNGNFDLEYISFKDVTEVGSYAFAMCDKLSKVDLPDTLIAIREHAFINRTGLTSIRIPPLVDTIETNAFYGCKNLKAVYIDSPTIVSLLISYYDCGFLIANAKYVYIKNDITDIGTYVTSNFTKSAEIDGYVLYIKNE